MPEISVIVPVYRAEAYLHACIDSILSQTFSDFELILVDDITETTVDEFMTTVNMPNPDLLIRTGGEIRLSNFLLWQLSYAEFYFTEEYWPDFTGESLYRAIVEYQARERRFGKTSEQL